MQRFLPFSVLAIVLAVSACGDTQTERGVSGAAIGAVAAAATDNDPLVGAAIGGAAGVFCSKITPQYCN